MSRGPGASYVGRFSGWTYPTGRALGHVRDWTPRGDDAALVDAVVATYADHDTERFGPLGPRGCGYRLEGRTVGGRLVVKGTEVPSGPGQAERLRKHHGGPVFTFRDIGETVALACRAERIRWEDVDDGRTVSLRPSVAADPADYLGRALDGLAPDYLADQRCRIEVWSEAAGGLGFWSAIAHRQGLPVYSGSGTAPAQAARALGLRAVVAERYHGQSTVVLVVTDHDPAGYVIADRLAADADAFARDYGASAEALTVERVALTEAQVEGYALGWGAAKSSHGRRMSRTAEAEALTGKRPDDAERLLTEAVGRWWDEDTAARTRSEWEARRDSVARALGGAA